MQFDSVISQPKRMNRLNEGVHLKLHQLRKMEIENGYLHKNKSIPAHPENVQFKTNLGGYHSIMTELGFRKPTADASKTRNLVWWRPYISNSDITNAEDQYLYENELESDKPFLHKFTSSPAFLPSSRLGNFRFRLSIHELLQNYSEQFCEGQEPNICIFETVVYKQEVMYSVVIHDPKSGDMFSEYPILQDTPDAVCAFHDDTIIWRPQAMSEIYRFRLFRSVKVCRVPVKQRRYYMWDNIGVALHVPHGRVFRFSKEKLDESLRLCEGTEPKLNKEEFVKCDFGPIKP